MKPSSLLAPIVFSLLAAACGSKSKPADTTMGGGGGTATAGGGDMPAAASWEQMDHDARKAYMKETVLPEMKKLFVEFDAGEFGNMNCKTCHGAGAEDGSFEMPNPELPVLSMDKFQNPGDDQAASGKKLPAKKAETKKPSAKKSATKKPARTAKKLKPRQ